MWKPDYEARLLRLAPFLVAAVLIAWVCEFHASMIGLGDISRYDEFYTVDRTTGFARMGDWLNVYSSNEVSFAKPPLQYWFSALLLENGADLTQALREPSAVFALLCLIATGLFAAAVLPRRPWVVPAAILLLSSSPRFWRSAISAMLDSGVLLFTTLALAATILALRQPRWWYVAAISVGLGAWQKAPAALAFVVLFLVFLMATARWHGFGPRKILTDRNFQVSAALALVLSFSWNLWQFAQHGFVALQSGVGNEMVDRFMPSAESSSGLGIGYVLQHIIGDEGALRWFGLIAVFALPWRLKRFELLPLPMILLGYLLAIGFAGGYVSSRYTVYFAPMVAVSLAAVVLTLPVPGRIQAIIVIAISLLSGGPVKRPFELGLFQSHRDKTQIAILEEIAARSGPDEALVFCNWIEDVRIPPGAISFYGSSGRRFAELSDARTFDLLVREGALGGKITGQCTAPELEVLKPYLSGLEIVDTLEGYNYYRAVIAAPTGESAAPAPDRD